MTPDLWQQQLKVNIIVIWVTVMGLTNVCDSYSDVLLLFVWEETRGTHSWFINTVRGNTLVITIGSNESVCLLIHVCQSDMTCCRWASGCLRCPQMYNWGYDTPQRWIQLQTMKINWQQFVELFHNSLFPTLPGCDLINVVTQYHPVDSHGN